MNWKSKEANWQIESPRLDNHKRLKQMSNMAWAKIRYNDTKGKNLPSHWSEVHPPLQCFGMEIDSLKEDDGVVNTI